MGNPFVEESDDLLVLDTRNKLDASVVETIKMIEYEALVTERLEKRTTSLYEPIKRNKLALFSSPPSCKEKSKDKMQIACLIVWWLMVKIVTGGDKLGHPFYN